MYQNNSTQRKYRNRCDWTEPVKQVTCWWICFLGSAKTTADIASRARSREDSAAGDGFNCSDWKATRAEASLFPWVLSRSSARASVRSYSPQGSWLLREWGPQMGVKVNAVAVHVVYRTPLRICFVVSMPAFWDLQVGGGFSPRITSLPTNVLCNVYSCSCELRSECVLSCMWACFWDAHICFGLRVFWLATRQYLYNDATFLRLPAVDTPLKKNNSAFRTATVSTAVCCDVKRSWETSPGCDVSAQIQYFFSIYTNIVLIKLP